MSNPSALGSVEVEAESAFAENVVTFATLRLPILDPVDASGLVHNKIDSSRTQQYRQQGSQWILADMGGSFKTRMYLPGHGTSTSGSPSLTALETFLGNVFGNAALSLATSTTASGGTAAAPTTAAASGISAGGIVFVGTLGDARGNGQAVAVATHATSTATLLTALPGAPNNGDVVYPAAMIYPNETPTSTTVTSYRMRLLTANMRYECHGCFPTAVSIKGFNSKEVLTIEITWQCAWWAYSTATFPSTVATDSSNPAVNAAGSLFINDVGTATRATRTYRNFQIDYTLGMEALPGPGGVSQYQSIVGARRTVDAIKVSWTEDADANTASPVLPGYATGTTFKHVLWTGSTTAGSRVAMYMPNVAVTAVPLQKADGNINRFEFSGMAYTGGTTTNDLTLSAWRMAFA